MKKLTVAFAALLSLAVSALAGPYDTWTNYRDVSINTTASGANVPGAVTDFPLLVRLTNVSPATGSDVLSGALAGGADLRFMSVSGAALSYQIERWSASNAEIWVRVPVVAGNTTTKIRMYWGNGAALAESNGAAVFDTANGYKAVWHMNQSSATANENDATINAVTLTTNGATAAVGNGIAVNATGPIGLARTLTGGTASGGADGTTANNNDWFQATGSASSMEFGQDGTYTFSAWVNPSDADNNRTLISKSDNNSTLKMNAGTPIAWEFTEYNQAGTQTNGWQATNAPNTNGTTQHLMGVRQGTSSKFYKDGVLVDSTLSTSANTGTRVTNQDFVIGRQATSVSDRYWAGTVDEVRISKVARSANFAKLDFETQKAATTAVTLGTSAVTGVRYSYVVDTLVATVGTAISNITPIVNATGLVSASVLPALPAGLTLNTSTGVISGTPTAVGAATDYVVTAILTGPDTTATATINLRVRAAALATFTYSTPDTTTYYVGVGITANNPSVTAVSGAAVVDSFTVSPALPSGLSLDKPSGVITGNPAGVVATANYTVTANTEAGSLSRVLRLTVSAAPVISYTETAVSFEGGLATAISPIVPASVSGTVVTWSVLPPLPAGLSLNASTGAISGTPTAGAVAADYTISATNPAGSGSDIINIAVTAPEDYSGWSTVKTLTLNTSAEAANVSTGQGGFPVLVRLTNAHGAIFGGAAAGGADIRFSKPDGARLAYEIETWNIADSTASIWVQLDTVNALGLTPLRIHYGNGGATSKSTGSRVFATAKGHLGVWHMGNPTGAVLTSVRPNSTTPGTNDALPRNFTAPNSLKVGAVGMADTLIRLTANADINETSDFFDLGDGFNNFQGKATMSMWINPVWPVANQFVQFLTVGNTVGTAGHNSYWIGRRGSGTAANQDDISVEVLGGATSGGRLDATTTAGALVQNQWQLVATTLDGLSRSVYRNGELVAGPSNSTQALRDTIRTRNFIGYSTFADATLRGKVDEVRISNAARSAGWMRLEYKNQKPGATPLFDLAYASPTISYPEFSAITANTVTLAGTATRYTISPALPNGLSFNTSTGAISGTPTVTSASTPYTVTAYGDSSWSTTATVNIAVTQVAPTALSYSTPGPVTYRAGDAIIPNNATITGSGLTYTVLPALPAGLVLNASTGRITGAASSAAPATDYVITATNASGFTTATVNITVIAAENYNTWANVKTFNVNATANAAGVSADVANFPVLVRLNKNHLAVFNGAEPGGVDVRFSKPDGTHLPYELESWRFSAADTSAAFWVTLDNVAAGAPTPVRIHWGKVGATNESRGHAVFDTANAFQGVWHLAEASASDSARDATLNRYTGAPSGALVDTVGAVGRAKFFNNTTVGTPTDFYVMPNTGLSTSRVNFATASNYTVASWVRLNATGASRSVVSKGDNHYALELRTSGTAWEFHEHYGAGDHISNAGVAPVTQTATWQHLVGVRDGANQSIYVNGFLRAGFTVDARGGTNNKTFNLAIGRNASAVDRGFLGMIDEVQISSASRSADWIKLAYKNQKIGVAPVSDLAYSAPSYTGTEDAPITPIPAPTVSFGTAARFGISPALPAGLTLNTATGEITGTPTEGVLNQPYTVTAYNDSAWSTTTAFNLTINTVAPSSLDYPADPVTAMVGFQITPVSPVFSGTITSFAILPALPSGLSMNPSTGVITGTPLVASAMTAYQITGTGPDGSDIDSLTITVNAAPEDYPSWTQNRFITINTSATGANVAGTVTNYPLLVRLGPAESAIFSQALAGGADVRFTKANGVTRLQHEIVSWNTTTKRAEIWVKVDSVKGNNASQTIKMLWGKAAAPDSSLPGAVFDTANGFVSVWHLGNAPDSSARPNAVTGAPPATPTFPTGFPTYGPTAGVIGMADTLRGGTGNTTTDHLSILNGSAFGSFTGYNSFPNGLSISVWANPSNSTSGSGFHRFIDINTNGTGNDRIFWGRNGTSAQLAYRVGSGTTSIGAAAGANAATDIVTDGKTWQLFTMVKENNSNYATMYKNGVAAPLGTTTSTHATIPTATKLFAWIGKSFDNANGAYAGQMDEMRVHNTVRSADWVKLDFETQKTFQIATDIGIQAPTLAYAPDSLNLMQLAPIATLTPVVSGTGVTYSGTLPAGLLLNASTGVITGTPTDPAATAKFTITATNSGGSVTDSLFITVNAAAPAIAYAVPPTYFVGTAITTLAPDSTAGPITGYTITPNLNAATGLSFNTTTGAISGTPTTIAAMASYKIVATGPGGIDSEFVSITVNPAVPVAPTVVSPAQDAPAEPLPLVVRWNNQGTPVASYQFQGSSDSTFATVGLDTTVSDTTLTVLSAPYASRIHVRVRATNISGTSAYSTVRSFTTIAAPPSISYATPKVFTVGAPIVALAPDTTGTGPITGYTINPNLNTNTGLAFSMATGVISGMPTMVSAATNYTIVATGPGGTDTSVVNIATSNELPPEITYANAATFVKGSAITPLVVDTLGSGSGPIDSFTVAPTLPAGLALAKLTGTISGTPSVVVAATDFVITAHGLGGVDSETVVITVNDIAPIISYASPKTFVVLQQADTLTPVSTGGAVITYSLLDSLPNGLLINAATGKIAGVPQGLAGIAAADYRVLASNTGGLDTATINITIHGAPVVTTAPHDTTVVSGDPASFTIAATAQGTLTYQWQKNNVNVVTGTGATTPTYSLAAATIADTGVYNVQLTSTLNGTESLLNYGGLNLHVNVAPVLATAPHDSTVVSGANASFTVAAAAMGTSSGSLSYQWRKGTTNLTNTAPFSNVTSATLTVTGATIADTAGNLNVVVTRTLDGTVTSTTSGNVALRVSTVPVIGSVSDDTTVVAGTAVGFTVDATAQGTLSYQWRRNGTNVTTGTGGTTANYAIAATAIGDTGSYTVVVTSTLNGIPASITSSAAALRVNVAPTIATAPRDSTILSGANAAFSVVAGTGPGTSAGTLSYQWRKGTTNLTNTAPFSNVTSATLTVTGATIADTAGNLNVVITRTLGTPATTTTTTSGNVALRVNTAPVITTQVRDTTGVAGANVSFTVAATAQGTLSYQWRKNGTNVTTGTGGTTATYAIAGVAIGDTGTYTVVVTSTLNSSVSSTTSASGGVLRVNVAPTITSTLRDTTVVSGTNANFSVVAASGPGSSAGTLSYQWRRGATNVGTNAATITLTGATIADTGVYSVVVTRTLGTPATTTSTTFTAGTLRVNAAPVIGSMSDDTTVVAGTAASFTVAATSVGGGTLSYQWRRGTTNVGTNAATLSLTGTAIADTGAYTVVVTSTLNAVTTTTTSTVANLRINVAPTITTQPAANPQIAIGTALSLTVAVATGPGTSAGTLSYQWRKNGVNVTTGTGGTTATYTIAAPVAADSGTYTVVITRTLNGTTTTTTSNNSVVRGPVGILPGSFVFRVTGADKPYSFVLPAGVAGVEEVKLSIVDIRGRNIWAGSINPAKDPKATEITWNGKTSKGVQASAGMYVVRIAVRNAEGVTTSYVRKSVTLKP